MQPVAAAAFLAILLIAGCFAEPPRSDVVTTFYPLGFLASRIGGDNVTVSDIVKPGVEPHDYEPTTTDIQRIGDARLLVIQGAGFETWLQTARAQAPNTLVAVATEGLALGPELAGADPHTWLDPLLYGAMADNVARGMSQAFPQHAASFRSRVAALHSDLARLDSDFETGLRHCETRFIITNHQAFGYMAARYNFTQIAISGLQPDAEPDPQTLARIEDAARAHAVTTIFFEDLVDPRVAEVIAKDIGGKTRILSPIEAIPADRLAAGADYFSVMRENLSQLREAMRCQ